MLNVITSKPLQAQKSYLLVQGDQVIVQQQCLASAYGSI
jgi:hypothetical protein